MESFRSAAILDGVPDDFWAILSDLDYLRAYNGAGGVSLTLEEEVREGHLLKRRLRYRSEAPVPFVLQPLLPHGVGYVEEAVFDEQARQYRHRITPHPLAERAELHATITAVPINDGQFERVYAGHVAVHLPLIGRRLARELAKTLSNEGDQHLSITRAWLKRRVQARESGQL